MKNFFWIVAMFASLSLATTTTSCSEEDEDEKTEETNNGGNSSNNNGGNNSGSNDNGGSTVVEEDLTFEFDGSIDLDNWTGGEEVTITFSGFPRTLAGLQKAQEQIGGRPEGAVLLQLFAFELYGHYYSTDKTTGEECIKLVNVSTNVNSVLRIIQDKYNPDYADTYMPYLVASYLDGATALNAYKANKPFSITVRTSPVNAPQDVTSAKGTDYFLDVLCHGVDDNADGGSWRACEVMKQKGSSYYKVFNSPGMYVGVQEVSFKIDDEYSDICDQ